MAAVWRSRDHPLFVGERFSAFPALARSDQDVEHGHSLFRALFATGEEAEDKGPACARAGSTAVLGVPLFSCFEMLVEYLCTLSGRPYITFVTAYSREEFHAELHGRPELWRKLSLQAGGTAELAAKLHCIDIRYVPTWRHCISLLLQFDLSLPPLSSEVSYAAHESTKMSSDKWALESISPVAALPQPPVAIVLHGLSRWQDEGTNVVPLVLAEASTFRSQIVPLVRSKWKEEVTALGGQSADIEAETESSSDPPLFYFDTTITASFIDMAASPPPPRLLDRVVVLNRPAGPPRQPGQPASIPNDDAEGSEQVP